MSNAMNLSFERFYILITIINITKKKLEYRFKTEILFQYTILLKWIIEDYNNMQIHYN